MKTIILQNFLKLHQNANVVVLSGPDLCELISYNKSFNINEYKQYLEDRNDEVSSLHMETLVKCNGDVQCFFKYLQRKISLTLSEFIEQDSYLVHQRMTIKDLHDVDYNFDDLAPDVKTKISMFTSLQRSSLKNFLTVLGDTEIQFQISTLKWASSTINFIELCNALHEGGCIISENGPLTKKEFIKQFSRLLNVNPGSWEITLNKAMSRENPAKFIDKLKSTITDYCTKLVNI
ncbi:MAG: RteC domain-containing protein [Bacteroidales bacterium]|nr:RteC domain-containing protein [Bacteroidales bacterium]